jgi:hypothetical protein
MMRSPVPEMGGPAHGMASYSRWLLASSTCFSRWIANLSYQQDVSAFNVAVVVLVARSNSLGRPAPACPSNSGGSCQSGARSGDTRRRLILHGRVHCDTGRRQAVPASRRLRARAWAYSHPALDTGRRFTSGRSLTKPLIRSNTFNRRLASSEWGKNLSPHVTECTTPELRTSRR